MPRCQHKNPINNSQENISLLESSNAATVDHDKCKVVEAQDKDFKIVLFKDLTGNLNKIH